MGEIVSISDAMADGYHRPHWGISTCEYAGVKDAYAVSVKVAPQSVYGNVFGRDCILYVGTNNHGAGSSQTLLRGAGMRTGNAAMLSSMELGIPLRAFREVAENRTSLEYLGTFVITKARRRARRDTRPRRRLKLLAPPPQVFRHKARDGVSRFYNLLVRQSAARRGFDLVAEPHVSAAVAKMDGAQTWEAPLG